MKPPISQTFRTALRRHYLHLRRALLAPLVPPPAPLPAGFADHCRSVLVLTMDRLGDCICSLPTLAALRKALPRARITVRSPALLRELLEAQPWVDCWQRSDRPPADQPYDLALDLSADYVLAKARMARRASRYQIGLDIYGRGAFLSHPQPAPPAGSHTVDKLLRLLRPLTSEKHDRQPRLTIDSAWQQQLDALPDLQNNMTDSPLVAIHPGGTYDTQRWPLQNWAEIARRLADLVGRPALVIGAPAERQLCLEIAANAPVINLCGRLSLGQLSALLHRARLLLANNSGPLHLACATGTATVSTMGPTLADCWYPMGDNHIVLQHDTLPCRPCNEGFCRTGDHACITGITVDTMWQAVCRQLSGDWS